ncbi:hypothetical protein GGS24DRAFT_494578 [Hypoxylon argillaceum]|nr:hypothetical protein GGS24DRAFT_494578 [Hypoxylon argillaceum]
MSTFQQTSSQVLLRKQDNPSALEQKLEELGQQEPCPGFLGKSRIDNNTERLSLLDKIESALYDYGMVLSYGSAQLRDVESLQNWLDGTGCLAREETECLSSRDLMSLAPAADNATMLLNTWIEARLIRLYRGFRRKSFHNFSNSPNVYIYSEPLIRRAAKALRLSLIALLLLILVVICNIINTTSGRIVVVIASTISYLLILSGLTKSRTMELTLAGATYATVLIVFVSGTNT